MGNPKDIRPLSTIDLVALVFGHRGKPVAKAAGLDKVVNIDTSYAGANTQVPEPIKKTLLDTPMLLPLEIGGFKFPFEPLIELSRAKKIIETELGGFENETGGAVTEEWSWKDLEITIEGFFQSDNGDYPEQQVRDFRAAIEVPGALEITNRLTTIFDVFRVVVKDFKLLSPPGMFDVQPFRLTCKEDKVFQLVIEEAL